MSGLGSRDRIVLDTLLPAGAHPLLPNGVLDIGFDDFYREFERDATPFLRRAFRLSLAAATWIAPLLVGRRPPLERHPREIRERALEAMASSRVVTLRQLVLVLKTVVGLCYGADTSVRESIGYSRRGPA